MNKVPRIVYVPYECFYHHCLILQDRLTLELWTKLPEAVYKISSCIFQNEACFYRCTLKKTNKQSLIILLVLFPMSIKVDNGGQYLDTDIQRSYAHQYT